MTRFRAIFHARNMEFLRDRGSLIWNIIFPVVLVFGFAFAFRGGGSTVFTIGYVGERPSDVAFFELEHVEFVPYLEFAIGIMNVVTLPMMLLSGVFFSLEASPPALQTASKFFPLTHFVEGARSIMLDGAGFAELLPSMGILLGFTLLFLTTASLLFRWE